MTDPTADRNLALEAVRVTERAAIAAAEKLGCGDEREADQAAAGAMRHMLDQLAFDGTIRLGDSLGEDGLKVGDKVGIGAGPRADVAALALEGKSIVARGGYNALSAIAMAEDGGFLHAPGLYMEKIAVGAGLPAGVISLDKSPEENLRDLADARGVSVNKLVVCMLDRPRHAATLQKLRDAGARVRLILDGDVSGLVAVCLGSSQVDLFMGSGYAAQGVLAAAALRGLEGQMEGRIIMRNNDDKARAQAAGIDDLNKVYRLEDLAAGNVTFAATGVTLGPLLKGIELRGACTVTNSMVIRSKSRTLRYIEGHHRSDDHGAA